MRGVILVLGWIAISVRSAEGCGRVPMPVAAAISLGQQGSKLGEVPIAKSAGALESLGVGRRDGMWAAGAAAGLGPDRLALAAGSEAPQLPGMSELEEMRADLWATGVSSRHPVEFVRNQLDEADCLSVAETLSHNRHGRRVRVGGIVTHRQRPNTANGVMFFNLEDETGLLNIVVLPEVWAKHRNVVRRSPALVIYGRLEFYDGVTNIVARDFQPIGVRTVKSRDFR